VIGYNNLDVGNVLTYSVNTNINPGTTYYYRVRAYNANGTSGNSNTISLTTVPAAPNATAATNIQETSFSANWDASSGATGYRLDVSTDSGFGSFVTGYNNLDVGNVLTYSVSSNINPNTTYYYRVRAYNANGTSGDSNTISLTTLNPANLTQNHYRWRNDNGGEAGLDIAQASATADTTTTSLTDVPVDSMTITPGAGDFLVWFSGSVENTRPVSGTNYYPFVSIYVGGVQVQHTERMITSEESIYNSSFPVATHARITGVTAGQAIDIRWRTTGGTATMHERTLVVFPIVAADSTEASATADTTTTSTTDVLVDSMEITPGAGDYLIWFSGSMECNDSSEHQYVSLYVGGSKLAHTERDLHRGFYSKHVISGCHPCPRDRCHGRSGHRGALADDGRHGDDA
jgi:hypothetical protein